MKSFQRIIKEKKASTDCRKPIEDFNGYHVKEITRSESKKIILEYEWLGTMGRAHACYGLFYQEELLGAINFGVPASIQSRNICGKELINKAICLERGACSHLTPKNAASFFISRTIKLANKKYGWEIFYAYADEEAGELGTIYQACNWYYLGQGVGRRPGRKREYFKTPSGEIITERTLFRRGLKKSLVILEGWKIITKVSKHKYVWFEGNKKRKKKLKEKCRFSFNEFPKRNSLFTNIQKDKNIFEYYDREQKMA